MSSLSYRRPGASPIIAALFAAGIVRAQDSILDVGCGNGTDSLALGAWGLAEVLGIDANPAKIAIARRRASRFQLNDRVSFVVCPVAQLADVVPASYFSVALDSMCWSNIHVQSPSETPRYVRQVARALQPGGLFVLQARAERHPLQIEDAPRALPRSFTRYFEMSPLLSTHMPEFDNRYVQIAVTVGRRRRVPLPR